MDDKILHSYFKGETNERDTQRVTEWLNSSEENMNYYLRECRLYEFVLWNEPAKNSINRKSLIIQFIQKGFQIAAVFLLGFFISDLLQNHETEPTAIMQEIHVPLGQYSQVTLSDGTKVWLNAGTTLKFPNLFTDNQRKVYLNGEGYFDVQTNKKKPFIVSTNKYQVKALGTSFNVIDYDSSSNFETGLITGKVEISSITGEKILQLTPQTKAVLTNNKLCIEKMNNSENYSWKEGILSFKEPIAKVFEKLEHYFDVKIEIKNLQILENTNNCVGKFRMRDGLEHILKVLQLSMPFRFKMNEDKKIVTIY